MSGAKLVLVICIVISSISLASPNSSIFLVTNFSQTYTGTAFELNTSKGKVTITNAHICDEESMLVAEITNPTRFKLLIVRKVYAKHDLCILSPVSALPALDLAEDYVVGEPVVVEGFPQGTHMISQGILGKFFTGLGDRIYILYKGPIFPGNSGSPVINKYGKVVGVIAVGTMRAPYWGGMVPLEFINDFLDKSCKQ